MSESVKAFEDRPNMLSSIISSAIAVLELVISKVFLRALGFADKSVIKELEQIQRSEPPKPAIPPRPKPSKEAASYKRLCEINQKLKAQNNAIFAAEQQRNELEEQLAGCKGIFKAGRRSELSRQIADKNERIANMKARLSGIVREYGFKNVESFYKALHKSESANEDYQNRSKKWEQQYGEKPQSLRKRLRTMEQEIRERPAEKEYRQMYDSDGNLLNSDGVAGMDMTGKSLSEKQQIISVSEEYRQKMFDLVKREYIQENGVANGDTTKRSDVYTAYQKSVKIDDRLKDSWTLGQYEKAYTRAMYNAVKAANPDWEIGQPFDSSILDTVTRESVEANLVQSGSTFVTKSVDYSV